VNGAAESEHEYRVLSTRERFKGSIFSLVSDEVAMPGGGSAVRDYTRHPGAVAVVALDDDGRVVLVRQYRHPVRDYLWEIPAGLRDVDGEADEATASRELAEEADIVATRWHLLVEVRTSPGYSNEMVRVFLARDLAPVEEADRHVREHEEADLTVHWFALDEAVAMVLRGEITNASTAVGLLAAARARDLDWAPLRPAS
jgi:8-oxo-dGTP pyrophosphatase MutT (NUDIX family)